MENNKIENNKITVENAYTKQKLELTISKESTIDDYVPVFRAILVWLQFGRKTIEEIFSKDFKED